MVIPPVRDDAGSARDASIDGGSAGSDAPDAAASIDASADAAASDGATEADSALPVLDGGGLDPDAAPPPLPDANILDPGGDDDAGTPPPRMDCTGKLGAPGNSTRTYNSRSFIVHVPENAHPNTALPVFFAVHGSGGKGVDMQAGMGLDQLADQQGFIAVYPDGAPGTASWNIGRGACPPASFASNRADDFSYFEYMLDDIEQDQCIDRERVFATGFSLGGYFSNHMGCQRGGDLVRGIAPHSGGTYEGDCPGAPLPVLILHGDADTIVSYQCGLESRELWADRNGCAEDFDVIDIQGGRCEWQRACPADGQVVMCTFEDLGHYWGYPPTYEHSTLLIWLFFSLYL